MRIDPLHALQAAAAAGGFAQSLAGSAGALLAQHLADSDAAAGLPQALLVVGSAGSALALTALTARRGRGTALLAGTAVALAGCVAVAVAAVFADLGGVLAGSVLLGCGTTTVMLGRYAAADLATESGRARAMGSVLLATTLGAVAGPNLLAPSGALASAMALPELVGPYLVAAVGFAAAGGVIVRGLGLRRSAVVAAPPARTPLGRTGVAGLATLGLANLVMVAVMTMAPVHLHHHGVGLGAVGVVISLHIGGMFVLSPVSGRLTSRFGAPRIAVASGVTLAAACALAATAAGHSVMLTLALVFLGLGWNLGLIAGSVLLTAGVAEAERPRREGWGEVGMGAAAAVGGAGSGVVVAAAGYPVLALLGSVVAALLLTMARQPLTAPPNVNAPLSLRASTRYSSTAGRE